MRNKKGNTARAYLFLLPSLAGILVFVLIPFLDVIRRSFYDAMGRKIVGFGNYALVLQNKAFRLAVSNTVRFLSVCLPLLLLLSLIIALLVQESGGLRQSFKTIFLIPMAVPVASVVLLWKLVFDKEGYLNRIIELLHLETLDWMNGDMAFYVLVFSYLWKNMGYDMILWIAGLNEIPSALYEAAKVDGGGRWQCFWYITLPNLKQLLLMVSVLSFVNSFKVFREAYLVAGDYPHESIYMLQHLFNNWFVHLDIHKMCAGAVMTSAVIVGLLILIQRFNNRDW